MKLEQHLIPSLRLVQNCTVCGESNHKPPIADAPSVKLFGVGAVQKLLARGVCPRCLRVHLPWTAENSNALAKWITERITKAEKKASKP
jgi:hypothetical protein